MIYGEFDTLGEEISSLPELMRGGRRRVLRRVAPGFEPSNERQFVVAHHEPLFLVSLALLEQQIVMEDRHSSSGASIGVKTPPLLLPFIDCVSNVLVMTDLHTCVLLQLQSSP